MIKIAHIADTHLDTPFQELPGPVAQVRRQTLRDCFLEALEGAAGFGAQLVLLCGDLFDNGQATPGSLRILSDFARENPMMSFFVSPGNHDCLYGASPYKSMEKPDNLYIFNSGAIERVDLPGCAVYGVGCLYETSDVSPLKGFHVEDPEKINIMCLHAQVQGFGGHKLYNPTALADIAQSGLDYLALGHVHTYSGLLSSGATYYAYPGALVGRGFDETGEKGYILGTVDKGFVDLQFTASRCGRFERIRLDVQGAQTQSEITQLVASRLDGLDRHTLLKLTLVGQRRADLLIHPAIIRQTLEGLLYVKVVDKTVPERNYEHLMEERTLTGLFLREVTGREDLPEEIRVKALSLGLAALAGEELMIDENP